MPVNAGKPLRWKKDIADSVDYYNRWFLAYAPKTFRETRIRTTEQVVTALRQTNSLRNIAPDLLMQYPNVLQMLRMSTAPPLARDRLIGLADVSSSLITGMEKENKTPQRMDASEVMTQLSRVSEVITKLIDLDIFVWLENDGNPTDTAIRRAATVVADRLTGAIANPLIRNAQERRQLHEIELWLEARGYRNVTAASKLNYNEIESGTFAFRFNIPIQQSGSERMVNLPIDTVIKPAGSSVSDFPILVEAKSAGDFANTNKRRKEEATKINQLRTTYGHDVKFVLFLCGYFDSGYLGYEAAEGIDWVWEHRIDDFKEFGL